MFQDVHPSISDQIGTVCMALALLHTLIAPRLRKVAHILAEVELVFPIWGLIFLFASVSFGQGLPNLHGRDFSEPVFIFFILLFTNTPWILRATEWLILALASRLARVLRMPRVMACYFCALTLGPILGSLITEPAAMTVTALLLKDWYFGAQTSRRFKYATLAVLFVNVSIGGVLTNFAAPPVLMVREAWNWSTSFMFMTFGWKSLIAITVNAVGALIWGRHELKSLAIREFERRERTPLPRGRQIWGAFEIVSGLKVALFLAGLVILGHQQAWWLNPLLKGGSVPQLFVGTTALTSITDNAALTFLSTRLSSTTDAMKYAILAGSVAGGGLTVIANAPNPAGFAILKESFGADGIGAGSLLLYALSPTLIAAACFWYL